MSKTDLTPAMLREICDRSFYHFVRTMNVVPPGVKPVSKQIHKPLCDFFQDRSIYRKAIAMPRAWMKSTVFTKWGAIWLYLQDNESRILIASENERNAGRFLHWIEQQILTNKMLRLVYPELEEIDKSYTRTHRWSASEADLPRIGVYSEPTLTAIGVGGAAQSGHYTDILIDDLVGKKARESPAVLHSVMGWFDNTPELLVQPDPSMPDPSSIYNIGTFWFPGDYLCYVHETAPAYQFRVVPCQKDESLENEHNFIWIQNPEADAGESNWDQFPTEYYDDMRANPEKELDYWAQHMNNPAKSTALTKFEEGWLKFFHWEYRGGVAYIVCDDDKEEIPLSAVPQIGLIDPGGFSDKKPTKGSSRNAILIGGQPMSSIKKFVTYTWCGKFKEPEQLYEAWKTANKKMRPRLWKQEIYGQQMYILKDIQMRAKKDKINARIIPMESDERKDAKDLNIQALATPAANGEIYIHKNMRELIAEWRSYPNSLTKDLLDMMAKLNQLHWKRGRRKDLEDLNARNLGIGYGKPNPRTGY